MLGQLSVKRASLSPALCRKKLQFYRACWNSPFCRREPMQSRRGDRRSSFLHRSRCPSLWLQEPLGSEEHTDEGETQDEGGEDGCDRAWASPHATSQ